jgi:hypothetical protein
MRSFAEGHDFKTLLLDDRDVAGVLTPGELERAFDLDEQFRHVDDIFDRVFQADGSRSGPTGERGIAERVGVAHARSGK